jgi:hypothetical protein
MKERFTPLSDPLNPRLALQRKPFFDYMDANPQERETFIKAALAEGGTRGLLTNFEQMCNYGNARSFTNTHEIVFSGFFGPINRGEAQNHHITGEELNLANEALDQVKAGSNILDYRTDQGMRGDPNYDREQQAVFRPTHINGNFFADHPMFGIGSKSWAAHQKLLDLNVMGTLLPAPQSASVEATSTPAHSEAPVPEVTVPITSTNLVIPQLGQKILTWLQMLGVGVATTFADQIGVLSFKGMPAYVAIAFIAAIEYYKHCYVHASNDATVELANAVEAKLKEQAGGVLKN